MKMIFRIGFTALTFAALSGGAQAANLLTNGSFEQPVLSAMSTNIAFYGLGSTAMTGWTVDKLPGGDAVVQLTNNSAFAGLTGTDGVQWLDLTGNVGRGAGVLSNGVATTAGTNYLVSFDVGAVYYNGSYGAATVDLYVNNALAGSYTVQPGATNGFNWVRYSYGFAGTGAPVTIGLYASKSLGSSNLGVGLDNVVMEAKAPVVPGVPEPASWALMIAGFGLTGAAVRRRKNVGAMCIA
ncbi:PEP-CTERM sorting domain-containing protein [Sandaracinobacter neustonicus]|uniref:PEP-CTERM sorting domain-containing protein n=1 Tax=Sandaracinobacter neustonicus TaxID=1715348 RepID=A0A501XT70_9SPHN|nr:PEPxxWA-CTERM sorting domain-containing protein [Sandaracinobacter neustonicus]TPE63619.1 PEP-CTERM sorting domain-containing protein [Sandaracinobacter neustonicus]